MQPLEFDFSSSYPFPPLLTLCLFGSLIYCVGVFGILINRRSLLFMLISLELALLGLVLCFSFVSICVLMPHGQLCSLLILVAAASESAIGLALVALWSRTGASLSVLQISRLKR